MGPRQSFPCEPTSSSRTGCAEGTANIDSLIDADTMPMKIFIEQGMSKSSLRTPSTDLTPSNDTSTDVDAISNISDDVEPVESESCALEEAKGFLQQQEA